MWMKLVFIQTKLNFNKLNNILKSFVLVDVENMCWATLEKEDS